MKITKLFRTNKDKQGRPLMGKNGRPYERIAIKTDYYGDRYLSGFSNDSNRDWREGDTIEVKVSESENTDKNGQPYLNFRQIEREDILEDKIELLEERVSKLEQGVRPQNTEENIEKGYQEPIDAEDILPF